mgnify:CR=1 FL=1
MKVVFETVIQECLLMWYVVFAVLIEQSPYQSSETAHELIPTGDPRTPFLRGSRLGLGSDAPSYAAADWKQPRTAVHIPRPHT